MNAQILTEIQYIHPGIATIPSLTSNVFFSWGKGSVNMSYKYGDRNEVEASQKEFFRKIGLDLASGISISPEHKDNIVIVDDYSHNQDIFGIPCDALVTYTNRPLILRAADCLAIVIKGKDKEDKDVISLIHAGRRGLEIGIIPKLLHILSDAQPYGVSLSSCQVGIMPSIAQKYYPVRKEDLMDESVWEGYAYEGKDGVYLNLLGAAISQLTKGGIIGDRIQAYEVDTYEAAIRGEAFSSRYSTSTNQPEKNGRFMIVACLHCPQPSIAFQQTPVQQQQAF